MNTKEKIAVMQAHLGGNTVQAARIGEGDWRPVPVEPIWDFASYSYRIKPEPRKPREWTLSEPVIGCVTRMAFPSYDSEYGFAGILVREVLRGEST